MARRDDMELMQHFDGELPEGAELRAEALSDEDEARLAGLAEISEATRTHLELAADDADARLDALWSRIERRIGANGESPAAATERESVRRAPAEDTGLLAAFGRWLDKYRGHLATGALAAGAAAALMFALRPTETVVRERLVQVPANDGAIQPAAAFVESQPPVVEELDVSDGTGTILTIPGDEGENPTTVIWVSQDDVEGPI